MSQTFLQSVVLAIIAFLLGLAADAIKATFKREKQSATYSVSVEPIVDVSPNLPPEVLDFLPAKQAINVVRHRIIANNTGSEPIEGAVLHVQLSSGATVLEHSVSFGALNVVRPVPMEALSLTLLEFKPIDIERRQGVEITLYLSSTSEHPQIVNIVWSGSGGKVDWKQSTLTGRTSVESHLIAIVRYFVFAQVMPPLFDGLGFVLAGSPLSYLLRSLAYSVNLPAGLFGDPTYWGVGLGQVLGSLFQLYFYLLIARRAVPVVREFMRTRQSRSL